MVICADSMSSISLQPAHKQNASSSAVEHFCSVPASVREAKATSFSVPSGWSCASGPQPHASLDIAIQCRIKQCKDRTGHKESLDHLKTGLCCRSPNESVLVTGTSMLRGHSSCKVRQKPVMSRLEYIKTSPQSCWTPHHKYTKQQAHTEVHTHIRLAGESQPKCPHFPTISLCW